MKHKHKWTRTGVCYYTSPLQYEEKCECGKTRFKVDKSSGIETINLTDEEMRKRHPDLFKNVI